MQNPMRQHGSAFATLCLLLTIIVSFSNCTVLFGHVFSDFAKDQ